MFSVALLLLLAAGSCVKCQLLTQPASVTVQPGQRLTITCQVSYSLGSYRTHWIRQPAGKGLEWIGRKYTGGSDYKDSLKNKFSIDLDSSSNTVTLNGQNVQPEDSAVYYCARDSNGWGYDAFDYWGKGTMVTVTATGTPIKPTVFPLVQCGSGSGDTVTLGCLATGFTPSSLTYSWSKNGTPLTDFIQYPAVQKNNVYTGISQIQVSRQDWNPRQRFQCVATNAAGNAQADIVPIGIGAMVTVQSTHAAGNAQADIVKPTKAYETVYQLPTVKVFASSDEEDKASFSCFATDFSPNSYKIKWLKNGEDFNNQTDKIEKTFVELEDKNGTKMYSAASFLKVKSSDWSHGTEFTCLFEGKGEKDIPAYKNSSVVYKDCDIPCRENVEIKIDGPLTADLFLNNKASLVCTVQIDEATPPKMSWEDGDRKDLVGTTTEAVKVKKNQFSLTLDISYEEWSRGIKRYCVVEHSTLLEPMKKLYERNIGGPIQRPSVFMLPPIEHTRKEIVTLTCYVKDFFPQEVFVSWLVDDEEPDSGYEFHTTNPVENHGSYSVYAQLSVSLDQWKQNDVVYSCAVHHESVANTTKAIVRSIGYKTFENTNLVNLNLNVPETCKAQ